MGCFIIPGWHWGYSSGTILHKTKSSLNFKIYLKTTYKYSTPV